MSKLPEMRAADATAAPSALNMTRLCAPAFALRRTEAEKAGETPALREAIAAEGKRDGDRLRARVMQCAGAVRHLVFARTAQPGNNDDFAAFVRNRLRRERPIEYLNDRLRVGRRINPLVQNAKRPQDQVG